MTGAGDRGATTLPPAGSADGPPALDQTLPITDRAQTSDLPLQAGQQVGPYVLERPLGRGGMAEVWLARPAADGQVEPVALKLPLVSLGSAGFLERLARERAILARLDHPHIARLIDAGVTASGQHYLALAYVDGIPFDRHCNERGLGVRQRLKLFMQVLAAVRHAHRQSVLHRDLKPSNILVTPQGRVQLLDFGIAKLLIDGQASETELTEQWGRALTPDYASPEQRVGATVTPRSDLYSLGVILYELLCGRRPGRARDDAIDQPPPPSRAVVADSAVARAEGGVRRLSRQLARDLDDIVLQAIQAAPERRQDDVQTLAAELQRVVAGQRVRPLAQRLRSRLQGAWRRLRAGLAIGSALLLALALSGRVHGLAASLETLLTPALPPPQQVVLVSIGTDDHQRLFQGRRPLDPGLLQQLVLRILAGKPAVLGVDIDTSAPGFAALRQSLDAAALARIVWGGDVVAQDDPRQPVVPRAVLGAADVGAPVQAALALTLVDGGSGRVRWYRRELSTSAGLRPSLGPALARFAGTTAPAADTATEPRSIRFVRTDRVDLPASVVLAPGFDWGGRIDGRVVLLGGRYDGGDMHPTPLGLLHGVDVLAQVVETERRGFGYARPALAPFFGLGLLQLALSLTLCTRFGPWRGLAASLALGTAAVAAPAAVGLLPAWAYALPFGLLATAVALALCLLRQRHGPATPAWVAAWRKRQGKGRAGPGGMTG